jgi:hypothetical protein
LLVKKQYNKYKSLFYTHHTLSFYIAPRLATALVHTQPESTTITALGGRLGLSALNTQTLKQALTHKSVEEEENNASLEFIGKIYIHREDNKNIDSIFYYK